MSVILAQEKDSYDPWIWESEPPEDCPFERSTEIVGVALTENYRHYKPDNGESNGDTWYPTWAANDTLYSPFAEGSCPRLSSSWEDLRGKPARKPSDGDSPRLLLQLNIEFTDGTTAEMHTDGTWKTSSGPIIHNGFFTGEEYDARLEKPGWKSAGYDDSEWDYVSMKSNPGGIILSQIMEPIKVNQTLKPISLTNPKPGVYVYDFDQLFGGWTRLHVQGQAGDEVTIKYSARLSDNGLLDKSRHPDRGETDYCTMKGGTPEIYEPTFTYHPSLYS